MEYNYLSPDGISISMENFSTKKAAHQYLKQWIKRFERQGYYSSNKGRIELEHLEECCTFVEI